MNNIIHKIPLKWEKSPAVHAMKYRKNEMLGQLTLLWVLWFINSISFSSLAPISKPPTGG